MSATSHSVARTFAGTFQELCDASTGTNGAAARCVPRGGAGHGSSDSSNHARTGGSAPFALASRRERCLKAASRARAPDTSDHIASSDRARTSAVVVWAGWPPRPRRRRSVAARARGISAEGATRARPREPTHARRRSDRLGQRSAGSAITHRAIQLALHHRTLQRAQPMRAQRDARFRFDRAGRRREAHALERAQYQPQEVAPIEGGRFVAARSLRAQREARGIVAVRVHYGRCCRSRSGRRRRPLRFRRDARPLRWSARSAIQDARSPLRSWTNSERCGCRIAFCSFSKAEG